MSNTISIVWSSDQRQLIADYKKRLELLESERGKLLDNAKAAEAASKATTAAWAAEKRTIEEIRRMKERAEREDLSIDSLHKKRLRELLALKKSGELTPEQHKEARTAERIRWQMALEEQHEERKRAALEKMMSTMRRARAERKLMEREAKQLIEQTATAQEKHTANLAKYNRLLQAGVITQEQYARAAAQSAEANREITKNPFSGMIGEIKGIAAAWLSVHGVVRLVGMEIQNIRDRQKEASEAQRPYAEKLFEVAKNYGPVDDKILSELDEKARAISRRSGAKPTDVLDALNSALAGRVGGTVQDAEAATEMAVQIAQRTPEAMAATARSYLTERGAYPGKSMQEIAGEQMVAKQLSPTLTDEAFAQHVGPHLATSKQFGNTYAEAAALSAVISQRMADTEGRISTNAFITMQTQLAQTLPGVKGGTLEKIRALNLPENAEVKAHLLGAMNSEWEERQKRSGEDSDDPKSHLYGERKAFLSLVSLLNMDKDAMGEFHANLERMPNNRAEAEAITANYVNLRTNHPTQRGADLARRTEADIEREKLADPKAEAAVLREYLQAKAKAIGDSTVSQFFQSADFEAGTGAGERDTLRKAIEMLEDRASSIENDARQRDLMNRNHSLIGELMKDFYGRHDSGRQDDQAARIRDFVEKDLKPRLNGGNVPPVNVNVNVVMPGGGEKAPAVPAAGLQQGG